MLGILLCCNLILAQDEGSGAEEAAEGEESSGIFCATSIVISNHYHKVICR